MASRRNWPTRRAHSAASGRARSRMEGRSTVNMGSFRRGHDIRIEVKDVVRIVLCLDAREPLVLLGTVRRAHAVLVHLGDEVDVAPRTSCVRPQRLPEGTRPRPVSLVEFGGRSVRADVEYVALGTAAAEGGLVLAHLAVGTVQDEGGAERQRRALPPAML